jgi:hypothetical protein
MATFWGLKWCVAPGSQPDNTGPATTGDQAAYVVNSSAKRMSGSDVHVAEPLPPLKPGRQVGWIFKNGEVVAIERHECDVRGAEDAS